MIHSLVLVIIMSVMTMILRFFPFLVFSNNTPGPILYLGKVLPYSIMAMLVVYCLRNTDFLSGSHGVAEVSATILYCINGNIIRCYLFFWELYFICLWYK